MKKLQLTTYWVVAGCLTATANLSFDYRFTSSVGLFPNVFNLAESADVYVNATCGQYESEVYCTLSSGSSSELECGVCDASKSDKAHSIELAVDGEETWWQSPSLQYGPEFNYVTITVDLKKVFQVAYILIKSGPSPRPGNWILERSINGQQWAPWQFFALSDEECWHAFGLEPSRGKPNFKYDEDVICTSYHSGLDPMENGEVHISLVNGRPGASGPSQTLVDFTQARFVRIRLQHLRMLPKDQQTQYDFLDKFRLRQYFYSIRDITIGGQCPCNGHASECPVNQVSMDYSCKCQHNTCGPLCDTCCPMYNQKRWRPGKFITGHECEMCQCFGHAGECFFDPQVEAERGSINIDGKYEGGGVCIGCRDNTTGVNCQLCKKGFYRPSGVSRYDKNPCKVCQCDTFGSTGLCHADREEGDPDGLHEPGDCICKPGYSGAKCTECARGFHHYPKCAACPCSLAGTLNGECDGHCLCKENVQGERCDQCKAGYYALHEANPKGCLQCFCYAVTNQCEAAELGVETIQHAEGWKAVDLRGAIRVDPYWSTMTSGVTVAEEDMEGADTYFWEAPEAYIGNRLFSYGQLVKIRTSWHRGRGDTAGIYIKCPDIVLEGEGMIIGTGFQSYQNDANTTIEVMLMEDKWYHIPNEVHEIPASNFREVKANFIGRRVFKEDFMRVLGSLKRLLIRAKFHTDQLEGSLYTASMEIGSQSSSNLRKTSAVERCLCPPGYDGLSCEKCIFGYTRVNNTLFAGECRKCDCNGHAPSCDPFSLKCSVCLHNTEGERCERCKPGFYGNPLNGSPEDCKPCKCPADQPSNNFSPTCEVAAVNFNKFSIAPEEYVCTACPRGYAGPHCERCDNGFFGNPLTIGDFCKPCDCSGNANSYAPNWCDSRTGECLECLGNTSGWKCDKCLDGFWGSAFSGKCKPCNCNQFGSHGNNCDLETGQCLCKPKYVGRTCSQCKDGFGQARAGCRRCDCDKVGAASEACDADSGQCECKSGVGGLACSACLENHYGFSPDGCKSCDCHRHGAKQSQCDEKTGQCQCHPLVEQRRCNQCKFGYWNINSGNGCEKCDCDPMGSFNTNCNDADGQCKCKAGIGGLKCDSCLVGYWGFSSKGCSKCAPCEKPGHICDPDTGRCVCPPLTEGDRCERCVTGSWDYDSYKGCKPCRCQASGSVSQQCDSLTGLCRCLQGFEGDRCDMCNPGYYNFPNCRPCNCNTGGTKEEECDDKGNCQCDKLGACKCKEHAEGRKCASCKLGTFGLSKANPKGCFDCFCFGRTRSCKQGDHVWTQLILPGSRQLTVSRGQTKLNVSHDLLVLPAAAAGEIKIGVESLFTTPLYWNLPAMFLGDKVLAYNGFLRFTTWSNGENPYSPGILREYPLVQLQGNHRIVLEHFPRKVSNSGRYEARIHEDDWVVKGTRLPATREMLMIALQGVQQILIRSSDTMEATRAKLESVSLDVGRITGSTVATAASSALRPAIGIEVCECPEEYNATSCQNPGIGFYRWYKEQFVTSEIIIDLVGQAKRCRCNGRAGTCHPETGECMNCKDNTAGPHCDICATGYYGNPMLNDRCKPCQCPSAQKNFAQTCSVSANGQFSCQCRPGYTGPKCDRCDYGYYGSPTDPLGVCLACDCNPFGSQSDQCDQVNGQCFCVPGVVGRDCSQCQPRHVLTKTKACKDCNNVCTGTLLNDLGRMGLLLNDSSIIGLDPTPMITLENYERRTNEFDAVVANGRDIKLRLKAAGGGVDLLRPQSELLMLETQKHTKATEEQRKRAPEITEGAKEARRLVNSLKEDVKDIMDILRSYAVGESADVKLNPSLEEARGILKSIQKQQSLSEVDIAVRTELSHARQILKLVRNALFGKEEVDKMKGGLKIAEKQINDLLQSIDKALGKIREAYRLIGDQSQSLSKTQKSVSESNSLLLLSKENHRQGQDLAKRSKKLLSEAQGFFQQLDSALLRLERRSKKLESQEIGISAVIEDYRTRYVLPCQANAEKLRSSAEQLKAMFENTVGVNAEEALKAANVYLTIVGALDAARDAAFQAADAAVSAYKKTDPPGSDDLGAQAELSRVRSEDLSQEAEGLRQNAVDMKYRLDKVQNEWQQQAVLIEHYVKSLDVMKREMDRRRLPLGGGYADDATKSASDALGEADRVAQSVIILAAKIQTELRAKVKEMQSFSPEELGHIPKKISEAKKTMQVVEKQSAYLSHRAKDIDELSSTVSHNLAALRSKVMMARHAADSVKISITNDWEEIDGCIRSYRINKASSMTSQISLIYAVDTDDRNGLLLYLPSTRRGDLERDNRDFMAVEMVDRRIRFLWNNGAGTHSITSNVTLETARNLAHEDHMWYKITAERVGNSGRLNVKKIKPVYDLPEFHRWVVGESSPDAHVMDLEPDDLLYIGGVPDVYRSRHLRSGGRFVGVLSEVTFDQDNVGLWNFVATRGCKETHPGISDRPLDHNCYTFNGHGYAKQRNIRNYDPRYLALSMEFRSFDENALLLFVINEDQTQYLFLSLRNGKVHLVINYGPTPGESLEFETVNTYNSGAWVKVEAARALRSEVETGVLRVTFNGVREDLMNTVNLPPANAAFKMQQCEMYFGGIPPVFDAARQLNKLNFRSFLGSMRSITVSNPGSNSILNPLYAERHKYNPNFGVEPHCEKKMIGLVSFEGTGLLELQSQSLRRNSSFGFGFKTIEPEGLLLLSTFQDQSGSSGDLGNFYSVSMESGRIFLYFSSSADPTKKLMFASDKVLNDGRLHNVVVVRRGQSLRIFIDDEEVSSSDELKFGRNVPDLSAPTKGGLYIGGLPSLVQFSVMNAGMTKSSAPFVGTIKNMAFLDDESIRIASMNKPTSFLKADIGREMNFEQLFHLTEETAADSQQSYQADVQEDTCSGLGFLDGLHAAHFSRHLDSTLSLKLTKEDLAKDFQLSMKIRTYDQDGLIFASINKKNVLLLYLQDTELRVEYHHRESVLEMEVTDTFSYGRWKHVRLIKNGSDLTVIVDGYKSATMQVPKKLHLNKHVWIGGMKSEELEALNMTAIPTFSGCIKDFVATSRKVYLISDLNTMSSLAKCPTEVETGFYINNGQISAEMPKEFRSGTLDVGLSFKAVEPAGVLLLAQTQIGNISMSLTATQLIGKIQGPSSQQTFELAHGLDFESCSPGWNNLKLLLTREELVVELNDRRFKPQSHKLRLPDKVGCFLYIGSEPGKADVFHGCVRNVSTNGNVLDKGRFQEKGETFLNSCPK